MKPLVAAATVFGLMLAGEGATQRPPSHARPAPAAELRPAAAFAVIRDRKTRSLALFEEAGKVIRHPRCLNCHPAGDRPTQADALIPHRPSVSRGPDGFGAPALHCASCHGRANFAPSGVPGGSAWHLAPRAMAWQGRTLGQICRQIKDPARNGGRTLAQIAEHMADDHLVGWAWHPGGARQPAPGTQAIFGEIVREWIKSGAACPLS